MLHHVGVLESWRGDGASRRSIEEREGGMTIKEASCQYSLKDSVFIM